MNPHRYADADIAAVERAIRAGMHFQRKIIPRLFRRVLHVRSDREYRAGFDIDGNEIRRRGLYAALAGTCEPYLEAVWHNFSSDKATVTEDVLTGRLPRRAWHKLCGLFRREPRTP